MALEYSDAERKKIMTEIEGDAPLSPKYAHFEVFRIMRDEFKYSPTTRVRVNDEFWPMLQRIAPQAASAFEMRMSFATSTQQEAAARAFGALGWVGKAGASKYNWFGGKKWDDIYVKQLIRRNGKQWIGTIVHLSLISEPPAIEQLPFEPLAGEIFIMESVPGALNSVEKTFPVACDYILERYSAISKMVTAANGGVNIELPYVVLKTQAVPPLANVSAQLFNLPLHECVRPMRIAKSSIKDLDLRGEDDLYLALCDFYEASTTIEILPADRPVFGPAEPFMLEGVQRWVRRTGSTAGRLILVIPTPRLMHYSLATLGRVLQLIKDSASHIDEREGDGFLANENGFVAIGISSGEPDEPYRSLNATELDQLVVISFEEVRAVGAAALKAGNDLPNKAQISGCLPKDTPDAVSQLLAHLVVACACRAKSHMQHDFKAYNKGKRWTGQVVKLAN